MRQQVLAAGLVWVCALCWSPERSIAQPGPEPRVSSFANPLDLRGADPDVLLDNGTYYLYSTSVPGAGFDVWTSANLVQWTHRGAAFRKTASSWGQRDFWAPCIIKAGGRYLLYYNAQGRDAPSEGARGHRICVAQATSPLGPFTDVAAPIWDPGDMVIDAHTFIDTDGKGYLYYTNGSVWVVPLDRSLTKVAGSPTLCINALQDWERKWNEAPYVMRYADKYVMFYSAPGYDMPVYSVGYALADSPTGPWTKPLGIPILTRTPSVSGPGHNSVTTSPDGREYFMVYHTHQQLSGGDPRQIAVDRMRFVPDPRFGIRVEVDGPTTLLQRLPSGATGPLAAASDEFDGSAINRDRWNIVNEEARAWRLSGGRLIISTSDGTATGPRYDIRNLFLQAAPPSDFEVSTRAEISVKSNPQQLLLTVWQDHNNYIRLANTYGLSSRSWQITRELGGEPFTFEVPNVMGDAVWMKILKRGRSYSCQVSINGQDWTNVGPPLAADFTELQVGITAASPGGSRRAEGSFDFFRVTAPGRTAAPTLGQPTVPPR